MTAFGFQEAAPKEIHKCLSLVHRNEHTASVAPWLRYAILVVFDTQDGESAEAGWEGIQPAVVGNTQCPLERNCEAVPDFQGVVFNASPNHERHPWRRFESSLVASM